ncbi:MAG: Flp pilus assembly protein CpaB [Candidatus Dormibacteria bacterium]
MSTSASNRRRRPPQVIIGVALIVVAFIGVLLASRFVGGSGGVGGARVAQKVQVLGASQLIKTGHTVTASDLTLVAVELPPTGASKDQAAFVGRVARADIPAGAPLTDLLLAAPPTVTAAKLYFALPAGSVALNIPATDISPYLQPGDEIDIIASLKGAAAGTGGLSQTKATLKSLRILAVGQPASPSAGNLVVQATLQEAEEIEFLIKNTEFIYVLKSPQDAGSATDPTTQGVDLGTFKAAFGFK